MVATHPLHRILGSPTCLATHSPMLDSSEFLHDSVGLKPSFFWFNVLFICVLFWVTAKALPTCQRKPWTISGFDQERRTCQHVQQRQRVVAVAHGIAVAIPTLASVWRPLVVAECWHRVRGLVHNLLGVGNPTSRVSKAEAPGFHRFLNFHAFSF